MRRAGMLLAALSLSGLLLYAVLPLASSPGERPVVDLLVERAPRETGATNLVSAVYLGYRAYDTLGEALVLLLTVTGVFFLARKEARA